MTVIEIITEKDMMSHLTDIKEMINNIIIQQEIIEIKEGLMKEMTCLMKSTIDITGVHLEKDIIGIQEMTVKNELIGQRNTIEDIIITGIIVIVDINFTLETIIKGTITRIIIIKVLVKIEVIDILVQIEMTDQIIEKLAIFVMEPTTLHHIAINSSRLIIITKNLIQIRPKLHKSHKYTILHTTMSIQQTRLG